MPSYEYRCSCGYTMTIVQSITDKENKPICAKCAVEMIRIYDKPAIEFKGGGWAGKEQ